MLRPRVVHRDAAHVVVRRRAHRDRLRRADRCRRPGRVRSRSGSAAAKRSPSASRASRKTLLARPRSARQIARATTSRGRELGAGHVGHEALAPVVDQDGALAAQRLRGERHGIAARAPWPSGGTARTRDRAGPRRPVPPWRGRCRWRRAGWSCAGRAADAAGRQHDGAGGQDAAAGRRRPAEHAGRPRRPSTHQVDGAEALQHRDRGLAAHRRGQRAAGSPRPVRRRRHGRSGGGCGPPPARAPSCRRRRGRSGRPARSAPRCSSAASAVTCPTTAGSHSPAPAAIVSAACRPACRPAPSAAAMPPCAQGLEASRRRAAPWSASGRPAAAPG